MIKYVSQHSVKSINVCDIVLMQLDKYTIYETERTFAGLIYINTRDLFGYQSTNPIKVSEKGVLTKNFIKEFREETDKHNESVEKLAVELRKEQLTNYNLGKIIKSSFQEDFFESSYLETKIRLYGRTLISFLDGISKPTDAIIFARQRVLQYELTDVEYNDLKK